MRGKLPSAKTNAAHVKKFVTAFMILLIVLAVVQQRNLLLQGPRSQYARYVEKARFPDFVMYFADAEFNLSTRSIIYRLQIDIHSRTSQGPDFNLNFYNFLTGGFIVRLNESKIGANSSYSYNKAGIADKLYGLSELYPYDSYYMNYHIVGSEKTLFGFDSQFEPFVQAYLKYPDSLNWEIEASVSKFVQENGLLSFDLLLRVLRVRGYGSLITLLPVLAGNLVLGSTLFLIKNKKQVRLTERLTVYISLFVLGPTLLYSLSSQLPLKLLPTTAELSVVALLVNTALFATLSNMSELTHRSLDKYAVTMAIVGTCLFMTIDTIFFMLYIVRVNPFFGLSVNTYQEISSWFVDPKVFEWILLIAPLYVVPYLKADHDFKSSELLIFSFGTSVLALSSLSTFYDPTVTMISIGYLSVAILLSLNSIKLSVIEILRYFQHLWIGPR
jgi:hypothetical protein